MSKKKSTKLVFITVGDYPDSFYQTPEPVKELLYDLEYRLLRKEEPFTWTSTETGETFTDDSWDEDTLRSLAMGMVQAKLGWGKEAVHLTVSRKEAKRLREAKKRNERRNDPPTATTFERDDGLAGDSGLSGTVSVKWEANGDVTTYAEYAAPGTAAKIMEGFDLSHCATLEGGVSDATIAEAEEIQRRRVGEGESTFDDLRAALADDLRRQEEAKLADIAHSVSPTMEISLDGGDTWTKPADERSVSEIAADKQIKHDQAVAEAALIETATLGHAFVSSGEASLMQHICGYTDGFTMCGKRWSEHLGFKPKEIPHGDSTIRHEL